MLHRKLESLRRARDYACVRTYDAEKSSIGGVESGCSDDWKLLIRNSSELNRHDIPSV
jgi:hypothetical protein